MSFSKAFPVNYVVGTGVDYGSINNSPDAFNVTLFSNDKHVERVTTESSVRARFRTNMITPFNFKGPWQVRLQELSVCNKQSMLIDVEIENKSLQRIVWKDSLPRRVYENMWDVYEETVHHLTNVMLELPDLSNELVYLTMYGGIYVVCMDGFTLGKMDDGKNMVLDLWEHLMKRSNEVVALPIKVYTTSSKFIAPKKSGATQWPSNLTWLHGGDIYIGKWNRHPTHTGLRQTALPNRHEFTFFPDRDQGEDFAIICSKRLIDALRIEQIQGLGCVPVEGDYDHFAMFVDKSPAGSFQIAEASHSIKVSPVMRAIPSNKFKVRDHHVIKLKDERRKEIESFQGTWSLQTDAISMRYLLDPTVLHPHKLDLFNIRIDELHVLEKEFSSGRYPDAKEIRFKPLTLEIHDLQTEDNILRQ